MSGILSGAVDQPAELKGYIAAIKGEKGDSFTYEDFTPEQLEKLAEEAAKIVEAGISVIVCLDEGDQATHTAPEIYNAILEKKAVVYHHTDRTTNEFISLKEASPSKAVFSKTGYPTGFDIFNIEIDANGTVSYETFLSADLVTQVVEKGEGVDSIVQVITTESGSEELDNKPVATGDAALALGKFCVAEGDSSAAVNYYNRVYGDRAFACGWGNELHGYCAFGTGANNAVPESGKCGSVFGANNTVSGEYAAAFGVQNVASGENALAAGQKVTASGKNAVAVGKETTASGENAVAGGYLSKATGNYALALGHTCEASAPASVAVGNRAKATAAYARALGVDVEASGAYSVACGQGVMARGKAQVVLGTFNTANSDARFIVGNGTADDARGNAFEIYDGKLVLGGKALLASDIERLTECTTRTAWDLDDIKSFIVQEIQSGGLCEQPKTLLVHNFSSGYVIFGKSYAIVELRAIPQSPSLSDAGHAYVVADIYTGSNSYKMYADYNPSEDLILYPPTFYGPYAVATQEYVQMYVAGLGLEDGKDGADGKDGVGIVSVTIEEVA